jgi:hypothetical protein
VGVLSQLRVAAAAHPEAAAPRPARPSETGQAVAVSALLTVAWHLVMPLGRPGRDALYYLRIATDTRAAVRSRYNYRVLLLWPTRWLGGDPRRTHLLLTVGCLAASGPLVYVLCRLLGAAHWSAMAATAGPLCSRGWAFFLFEPWRSDPAALLLLAGCFLALVAGWLWALPPLAMLLATSRELAVGLVLPVYAFLARRRVDLFAAAVALTTAVGYRAVVALQRARHRPLPLGLLAAQALVPLVDVADGRLTVNHPSPSLAFTAILMTLTVLALWWPRFPVRHG